MINLSQVSPGRKTIMNRQVKMPIIGTKGTQGVLKALGASGKVFLITRTPRHTSINANRVPILVISPTTRAGINAANKLTNIMNKKLLLAGVLNSGCTSENIFGIKPSWDILKNTLD